MSSRAAAALLAQRHRVAEGALPVVEDFMTGVSQRLRARLVNRSGVEVAVRMAGVRVMEMGNVVDDPEYREGAVYSMLRFKTADVPGLVILQGSLLTRVVGSMLGEHDVEEQVEYRARARTKLELRIAKRICDDLVEEFVAGWPSDPKPNIRQEGPVSSPRLVEGGAPTAPVLTCTLDFGPPAEPYGLMIVAIPAGLTADIDYVAARQEQNNEKAGPVDFTPVMPIEVDLSVELARVYMSLKEIGDLEVGTMIPLGHLGPALVKINDKPTLEVELGEQAGFHSFRVLKRIT